MPSEETLRKIPWCRGCYAGFIELGFTYWTIRRVTGVLEKGTNRHAISRARREGLPLALFPGPQELRALMEDCFHQVTPDDVIIRKQPRRSKNRGPRRNVNHRRSICPKPILKRNLFGPMIQKDPRRVGHKVALLNQLKAEFTHLSDPDIHLSYAREGASFKAFELFEP